MNDVIFEQIEFFSIKFQKSAISRLNNISRKSSISRFSNSFFICILWICSDFRRVFFVNSKNLEMKNSANWFVKSLKYFFLMMFSFHVTSSSDLESSETQISLSFIFWFLRLYAMNTFVEFVERKNWTKFIKSFFLESLNSLFCTNLIVDWNIRNSFLIRSCFSILTILIFVDWDKEKTFFFEKKSFFFLSSINILKKTTWSNFHFELNKILLALTINDERILIQQTFDLNCILSRDFLATFLVKILFALTMNDERIFIKSNSNSVFVWSSCEQSANLDVSLLKRWLFNLKSHRHQKRRSSSCDSQNYDDSKL
jgi:hypothetical protein